MRASARVLVALFMLSFPVLAQEAAGGGTIRGQILPARGESDVPGMVMVRLVGAGFQQVTYVSGAYFSFSGLQDGNYTLYVSANGRDEVVQEVPGFRSDREDTLTITLGDRTADKDVPAPGSSPTIDVKTLKVPEKALSELQKGVQELDKTQFQKAAAHFESALKICPEFYQAHNNLGVAYLKLSRLPEAEKEFARAVEISPDNLAGLKNLAYIRMNLGLYDKAIDPLAKAVRIDGNDPKAEMYLGEAYTMKKDFSDAKEHFLKAVLLDPTLSHAHYRLGYIFLGEKQYDEALKHFRGFLKLNPPNGREEIQGVVAKLEEYFKDSLARMSISPMP